MIRNMGKDCMNGLMAKSTMGSGMMESSMVKGNTIVVLKLHGSQVFGKTGKDLNGLKKIYDFNNNTN